MFQTDRLLALNNSIGLLVVAALNPDEPDFDNLIREFRLCLNNYDAWAEQFWTGTALDIEQVFTVGNDVRLSAPIKSRQPLSSSVVMCPASGELTLDAYCAARHMLVSFSGRPYGFIDEALASLGRKRHVLITVNQFFTAGRVVVGSDLLTVLPRHFVPVTGIADRLVQRPLPLNVPAVHVDALWRRRGPQEKAMEWLLNALARSARSMFPD